MINDFNSSLDSFIESSKNNNQKLYIILYKASLFNDTKTIEIYTDSLSNAHPICIF